MLVNNIYVHSNKEEALYVTDSNESHTDSIKKRNESGRIEKDSRGLGRGSDGVEGSRHCRIQ